MARSTSSAAGRSGRRSSEQGHLVATPGSVIDYAYIEQHIADIAERFRAEVIIDRWNSTAVVTRLGAASRMIGQDAVLSRITSITPSIKRIQRRKPASA
jgi:phage terminase large subunit-like protein